MVEIRDVGQAQLYARALLAIARADEHIGREEGQRLERCITARTPDQPFRIDDLLLTEPLEPAQLARDLWTTTSPFRTSGLHASELARLIVLDSIAVVLAKGYVSEVEGREVIRFATALGCTLDEVRAMSDHLLLWIGSALT